MDEDYGKTYGIDKLAELLIERGIEFCVKDETSLFFMDGSGNPHECWMAGAEENLVNAMIAVTPEQLLSVPDLNGVIAENDWLRGQVDRLQPKDCEGNALDIADTVSMLRSEYDGDHEWDDVVVELVLTKWGGDRWIVRGSRGEAWACDCLKTGYDEDAYEGSGDAEPIADPSLVEVENAKLRDLLQRTWDVFHDATSREFNDVKNELRDLGIEVD